jgi:hypothetical protein
MSWQVDLDYGLAQRLADAGVGTWAPDDVIDGQINPIILGSLPPDVDQCIGIITVPVASDPVYPVSTVIAQFRIRGTATQNRDTASAIDDAVNGLQNVELGTAVLTDAQFQSATADAPNDTGQQLERTVQYRIELDLPATALRSY